MGWLHGWCSVGRSVVGFAACFEALTLRHDEVLVEGDGAFVRKQRYAERFLTQKKDRKCARRRLLCLS